MLVELEGLDGLYVWLGGPDTDGSEERETAARAILAQLLNLEPPRCASGNSALYALDKNDLPLVICLGDMVDVVVEGDFFYLQLRDGGRCKLTVEPSDLLTLQTIKAVLAGIIQEGRQVLLCQGSDSQVVGVDHSDLRSRTITVVRADSPDPAARAQRYDFGFKGGYQRPDRPSVTTVE